MWPRKRLDIGWSDLLFGVFRVCFPPDRAAVAARVEELWPAPEHTLARLLYQYHPELALRRMFTLRENMLHFLKWTRYFKV